VNLGKQRSPTVRTKGIAISTSPNQLSHAHSVLLESVNQCALPPYSLLLFVFPTYIPLPVLFGHSASNSPVCRSSTCRCCSLLLPMPHLTRLPCVPIVLRVNPSR